MNPWLARVTVGSPDIAPYRNDVPIAMRRATFGASPAEVFECR